MHQGSMLNSAIATAVLCLGLLRSFSRAFVRPPALHVALPSNVIRCQQQQEQQKHEQRRTGKGTLYCSSTRKPSLKPSWISPRWQDPSTLSSSVQRNPAAVDVPDDKPSQRVPNMSASSSKYGKPTWKSTKTTNNIGSSSSSSSNSNNVSSPGAKDSPASSSPPVLESLSGASPAETSSPEEPAQTVPPARSFSAPAATTDGLPQPMAEPVTSARPTPPLPLKERPSRAKAVMEDVGITIRRAKEALAPFRKKLQDNIAEGNVGDRGEEWAVAQAVILLFIALGTVPVVGGVVTLLAGPGLIVGGVAVGAAGVTGLGRSLSPWPAPVADNELKTGGIYGIMRHPTYIGLIMACLGFGVITDSPLRMLLAVLLAVVLDRKSEKEERMLVGLHGKAYEEYQATVAKFFPGIY